ncbi:transcriptional regulator [Desulfonispora thiosulfatigenes DSM 11270]|uniref:Transcriptional regulator n=1 Tax=Desulfonispora thiosulfatigenes DSM 11270 TaxID=656914 RepID=A0A1W1VFZ3_DESTI|nr:selenium metabolism-associated LysR family transcriptional regulator [Desulfonispora thiosulfatigenes]SMB92329.1 transcriptional regulator [Desulfonispora thiosulfatigenes DSM 11270]
MNLRQISIFTRVAEIGSMSETARQLFMTQPAVSQTIAELEDDLQMKLFDRINRKLILTNSGEVLYNYCKKILSLLEEAEHTMRDLATLKIGKLRLGASTTIGIYFLPRMVGDFKKRYGRITTQFTIDNTGVIEDMILNHAIDIGLVEGKVHSPDIKVHYLFDDELYLICSKNHRWVKENKLNIAPEDLVKEQLISREKGSGTREMVEEILEEQGLSLEVTHILNNTEAIKKAVEEDMGISFVSKMALVDELKSEKLVKIKIEGIHITRSISIIYHKDKYRSPLLDAFLEHINSYKTD